MKLSELSSKTGVSAATIKFYAREKLLPPGRAVGPREAEYGEEHVERLGAIRDLREVAGLPVASIRALMSAVDDPAVPLFRLMGMAQAAVLPEPPEPAPDPSSAAALYAQLGWAIPAGSSIQHRTAHLLGLLEAEGVGTDARTLAPWIEAASLTARAETAGLDPEASRVKVVRDIAVGAWLGNQLMLTLRMAAQIDCVARRMGPTVE